MKKYYAAPYIKVIKIEFESSMLAGSDPSDPTSPVITTRPTESFRTGANDYIGTGTDNGDFTEVDEID